MLSGQPVLSPALIIVCVIMAITAGLIYWVAALGSPWTVPWAAIRAAVQLAAIAGVLAAALTRLWSSTLVLAVMFVVASLTAARRSQASRGSALLTVSLLRRLRPSCVVIAWYPGARRNDAAIQRSAATTTIQTSGPRSKRFISMMSGHERAFTFLERRD